MRSRRSKMLARLSKRLSSRDSRQSTVVSLLSLPSELLIIVVDWAGLLDESVDTLFATRLSCRSLRDASWPLFINRYFQKRSHFLGEDSLQCLVDISQHPILGPCVSSLDISLRRIALDKVATLPLNPGIWPRELKPKIPDDVALLLDKAMLNLRNCRSVSIVGPAAMRWKPAPWGVNRFTQALDREYGKGGWRYDPFKSPYLDRSSVVDYTLYVVLSAVSKSAVELHAFSIDFERGDYYNNFYVDHDSIIGSIPLGLSEQFRNLQKLSLDLKAIITSPKPYQPSSLPTQLIDLAPNLTELSLGFSGKEICDGTLLRLAEHSSELPPLKSLCLTECSANLDPFVAFLRSHKKTLRSLTLIFFRILSTYPAGDAKDEINPWGDVIKTLRELDLDYLSIHSSLLDTNCVEFFNKEGVGVYSVLVYAAGVEKVRKTLGEIAGVRRLGSVDTSIRQE
ncbi:hypothetical protein P152DRAFT_111164 [Eremomyces bilateralis CBS 781.70]|uniref:Uncharacterized protein n=1 Tax=Eremomyces bilateralis CBS 781.70 TaxID=1392243 RepID=A0A6G1GDK0_9PEZI|nr:uncharacterized protein P152DRAFT_111164 [Eremomyces bilateralis CBS 781.70]KAF1816118.1 hypothetical protein P152DRAFT_111164 [Eremomyces bilateralis CBS 781.70]